LSAGVEVREFQIKEKVENGEINNGLRGGREKQ